MEDTGTLYGRSWSKDEKRITFADQLAALFGDSPDESKPRIENKSSNESINDTGGDSDWPSNAETSKIKDCFEGHLQSVVNPEVLKGLFVEFTLFSNRFQQMKAFARINQTVVAQQGDVIGFEIQVPRWNEKPKERKIAAKDLHNPQFYYFSFPMLIAKTEIPDFAEYLAKDQKKDDDYGFIVRESKPEYLLQPYPTYDRNKLPWIMVVSSLFLREVGKRREIIKPFLTRMVIGDRRLIVNYKPGSGYPIKDFLGLDVEEEKNIREAHDLARLITYLRLDFSALFNKPIGKLFSKEGS